MIKPQLTSQEAGHYLLTGDLTFDTVATLGEEAQKVFTASASVQTVNLEQVQRVDSAALALLLEWLRQARQHNNSLTFIHIPPQLQALMHVCHLNTLFNVAA